MRIDHLVVLAERLEDGVGAVEDMLGVRMAPGGRHGTMGTHNRLLSLGPDSYLEVLAVDPDTAAPGRKRWFGLDTFSGVPRMGHWVAAVGNLRAALGSAPIGMGEILRLTRGDLEWSMAVPASGRLPGDGVLPAMIQWHGPRAQDHLPDSGCKLKRIVLRHPDMDRLQAEWPGMAAMTGVATDIGPLPALEAEIVTARGLVTLSSLTETV